MPQRLHRVECLVTPERRLILVLGVGADAGGFLPDFGEGRLCYADRDVMYLASVSEYHDAEVVLEAWDAAPVDYLAVTPAERVETVDMELAGGVFVCALFAPALTPVMPVGPPGPYTARVCVTGQAEVLRRVEADLDDRPVGVERFTIRFWPAVA